MVKFIIKLLILVIVVLGAVLLVRDDPGVVMLRYRGWTIDTSLAVGLAVLIVVRTFINWTLILDLEERWPWQPKRAEAAQIA